MKEVKAAMFVVEAELPNIDLFVYITLQTYSYEKLTMYTTCYFSKKVRNKNEKC